MDYEGSGWIIESIDSEYLSISANNPLVGSTYIELPDELKHLMKGQINIRNKDNKYFLWRHVIHLNLVERNPQRIAKKDKEMVIEVDYNGIPVSRRNYCKIERQNNICINVFCYENRLTYLFLLSNQKFKNCMDLLLISDGCKSHYVYVKDFDRFMFNKTKNKNKKCFCKSCLQCFSNEKF